LQRLELFLASNNFLPNELQEDVIYNFKSIRGLRREELSNRDETFLINSLFSRMGFIDFDDPKNFDIDRVKENEEVNEFWIEVFKRYSVNYSMCKNEFSIFSFNKQQEVLIQKAFALNIKELPIEMLRADFEYLTNRGKNELFETRMKETVLGIFESTSMERKIRNEYLDLALKINEDYFGDSVQ
jgi:hypothetical protein